MQKIEYLSPSEIHPYGRNPRRNDDAVQYVANSIREFGFRQPIVVDKDRTIIVGHTRWKASQVLKLKTVPVIVADDLNPEQVKAYRIADNSVADVAEWDYDLLAEEWDGLDYELTDFGFTFSTDEQDVEFGNLDKIAGKKDEKYQEFVDKFKPKVTTDDCYTPEKVYEALKGWVFREYGEREVVRPFYPGGDYTKAEYPEGCLVLDNPPFSIESKIIAWYLEKGIDFFLFAPTLTCFNNLKPGVNAVFGGASIVYQNGADVPTAFLTTLGTHRIRVCSDLFEVMESAQPKETKELGAYQFPDEVVQGIQLDRLAKYGSSVELDYIAPINKMDNGPQIYGRGFLVSTAEAEKVKAEKVKAVILLSEREREIVRQLDALEAQNPQKPKSPIPD